MTATTGMVDDYGRALLPLRVGHPDGGGTEDSAAWVDTAFTGELLLPTPLIAALALPRRGDLPTRLADGSEIQMPVYKCVIEWFGQKRRVEVLPTENQFPLIGVVLMLGRTLTIDYPARTVTLV